MEDITYYVLALLWIAACVLLGLYVRGKSFGGTKHYRMGLMVLVFFYLLGLGFLIFAIGFN